jgi:hypothetical protein
MAQHRIGQNQKTTAIAFLLFLMGVSQAACVLGPVETDPAKAAERNAMMREDCYKRGGVWYDDKGVCVGADVQRK